MSNFLQQAQSAVTGTDWEEIPVDIDTFVTSEDFLNLPPLSPLQSEMLRASTQIYKEETLIGLYGPEKGQKRFAETFTEIILALGKGSGKDHISVIACCYVVYLLLCLKNPSKYYGYPDDEPIDIINIAINADQARNVFFKRFKTRIEKCPWFIGKFKPGSSTIEFDKSVTVYSGHSEREAFEGLNLIFAVLDEISGFALESNTGNDRADTADATYKMYRNSVDSRYPDFGKVVMLSWVRFAGDYISQRYGGYDDLEKGIIGAVAEKNVIIRRHTFKLDEELPDGIEGNEFTIEWEEDHILRYSFPGLYALKRPSWEVNPTKKIEDYKRAFYTDPADALARFACTPTTKTDTAFFKDKDSIRRSFVQTNGVDNEGVFYSGFTPGNHEYYIHVDLSKVHDRCAISMAHVDKWVAPENAMYGEYMPLVVVDAIRWWKPSKNEPMDYKAVVNFILALKRRGFNIKLVTFDNWNSIDTRNTLEKHHVETDTLAVGNQHYDDFLSIMYDDRLRGPALAELIDELDQLQYIKGKVDHPRAGYKDLSDATCGAIWNAVNRTTKKAHQAVEPVTLSSIKKEMRAERGNPRNIINPPPMPEDLRNELSAVTRATFKII